MSPPTNVCYPAHKHKGVHQLLRELFCCFWWRSHYLISLGGYTNMERLLEPTWRQILLNLLSNKEVTSAQATFLRVSQQWRWNIKLKVIRVVSYGNVFVTRGTPVLNAALGEVSIFSKRILNRLVDVNANLTRRVLDKLILENRARRSLEIVRPVS